MSVNWEYWTVTGNIQISTLDGLKDLNRRSEIIILLEENTEGRLLCSNIFLFDTQANTTKAKLNKTRRLHLTKSFQLNNEKNQQSESQPTK